MIEITLPSEQRLVNLRIIDGDGTLTEKQVPIGTHLRAYYEEGSAENAGETIEFTCVLKKVRGAPDSVELRLNEIKTTHRGWTRPEDVGWFPRRQFKYFKILALPRMNIVPPREPKVA